MNLNCDAQAFLLLPLVFARPQVAFTIRPHHNYLNTSDIITFHYHMPLLHVEMLTILGVLIKFTVLKFLCSGGVRHLQRGRFACPRLGSSVTCCCCCSSTWLPCTGIFTLTLNVNLYLHLCACAWPVAIGT